MKKSLVWIASMVLLAGVAACGSTDEEPEGVSSATEPRRTDASACKILTPEVAKKFFDGPSDDAQEAPEQKPTDDLVVTNCTYMSKVAPGKAKAVEQAGLLVRAAQNIAGATDNENGFKLQRAKADKDVPGLGDSAYWSPATGQLNVLENSNWYIISAGAVLPSARELADAKMLADLISDQL